MTVRVASTVAAYGLVVLGLTWAGSSDNAAEAQTPLERGTYLMQAVIACGNCHTPKGPNGELPGMELAGGFVIDEEPFTARVPNITQDEKTGIGSWTDEQIMTAVRDGVRPDGSIIGPPMAIAFYKHISDDDMAAIVAYLRTVPAIENEVEPSEYRIPLPESYGPPAVNVSAPSPDDDVAYGEYLVTVAHCLECHTPMTEDGRLDTSRLGAGGAEFEGPWGLSVSANLTPNGLEGYSDEELAAIIRTGVRPDGSRLKPPMAVPYYAKITDADIGKMIAYLRTLPRQ